MEDQPPVPYSETTLSLKLSYRHADPDDDDEPALSLGLPEPSSSSSRRPSDHGALRIKREKEASCDEEEEEDGGGARKKLRLSKEQAALLEDKFKEHSTLNPKQKQALARQLKLLPRQVEVWFQNRRARTKLKKIEVEREILRKHCEALREENKRLKKELHELKSTTRFVQSPRAGGAAFVICSSCKKVINDGSVKAEVAKAKPQYSFNNPFARSAAC